MDKPAGLGARLLGDLATVLHLNNSKRGNAAMALVVGIILLDLAAFAGVRRLQQRRPGSRPRGAQASRGFNRKDFATPVDYRAEDIVIWDPRRKGGSSFR